METEIKYKGGLWFDCDEPFISTKGFHSLFEGRESHRNVHTRGLERKALGRSLRKDQSKQTGEAVGSA